MQILKKEYGLKQDEIAEKVFKSRTVITNALRLLKLDDSVQQMLIEGLISTGHAKVLLSLEDSFSQKSIADRIVDENLLVRRIYVVAAGLKTEEEGKKQSEYVQLDLMTDYAEIEREEKKDEREKNLQKALLDIKKKYGKNAVLKGTNFVEGATMKSRNEQIGGHRA